MGAAPGQPLGGSVTTKEAVQAGFAVSCGVCEKLLSVEDFLPDETFHPECQKRQKE